MREPAESRPEQNTAASSPSSTVALNKSEIAEFEALVRAEHPRLWTLAVRVLGTTTDVEDVLQEAYLKAFRAHRVARAHQGGTREGWLYQIVYRTAIDAVRRRNSHPQDNPNPVSDGSAQSRALSTTDHAASIATALDLERVLAALTPDARAAVTLVDLLGFDYQTAAVILETNRGTIASRLHTARATIREHLDSAETTWSAS